MFYELIIIFSPDVQRPAEDQPNKQEESSRQPGSDSCNEAFLCSF